LIDNNTVFIYACSAGAAFFLFISWVEFCAFPLTG
jgi:hypothetical protein